MRPLDKRERNIQANIEPSLDCASFLSSLFIVTEAYKLAPAEQCQITTENLNSESDKTKIWLDLKPKPLYHDATPVKYRVWTTELAVFFQGSKLNKAYIIERQQALLKLLDSQLVKEESTTKPQSFPPNSKLGLSTWLFKTWTYKQSAVSAPWTHTSGQQTRYSNAKRRDYYQSTIKIQRPRLRKGKNV